MRTKIFFSLIIFLSVILVSCNKKSEGLSSEEVPFDEETKTGILSTFHDNGKLAATVKYVNGEKHGLSRSYYENGNLKASVNYKYNVKQGEAKSYYKNGKLYRETFYLEGEIDGIRKKFREDGTVYAEIPYKYGWPGKGLKEYLVNGNEKSNYPELKTEILRAPGSKEISFVKCYFEGEGSNAEYYFGELKNGQFMHGKLIELPSFESGAILDVTRLPASVKGQKLTIIGKINTKLKNPFIQDKVINP